MSYSKISFVVVALLLIGCQSKKSKTTAFVPQSSGNINSVVVVMPEKDWDGALGNTVREVLQTPYEGLPIDEPQFSINYISPKAFSGFARQSRNVVWFRKDATAGFNLSQNQFADPQLVVHITGEDSEIQSFYLTENSVLLRQYISENERVEKIRRVKKALGKQDPFLNKFNVGLEFPSAYKPVKDTTNFLWIQKEVQKGHLNLIAYTLPLGALKGKINERIITIRDSMGKRYVPGRLDNSYLITEAAYRPYFYKTALAGMPALLTKGTWEVKNDFMAGPFVNYMVKDTLNEQWLCLEGFAFAPSMSKRDYMFELNTIISTLKFK